MSGLTDYNDLHVERGLNTVSQQILLAKGAVEKKCQHPSAAICETVDAERDFNLNTVLDNFIVLFGKGGGLFYKPDCEFLSKSDFELVAGRGIAKAFFEHPLRKIVKRKNIIFDPNKIDVADGFINLYQGLPMLPKKGNCSLLLNLLHHLCEGDDAVFDWVIKWAAYPLQNPGAKMRTAIVIHGPEGAGKNLFWSVLERIYGEYSTVISQTDLESSFNGWASRKLFVIGNEVVSRQEMFHKKGVMKNMITEPEWIINEKNINQRKEANHANFVFFSNFLQPVAPDRGDRRYLILWTPAKKDKEFYKAVAAERDNGGAEALYDYLLKYDLGDFDEYSETIMTSAKETLINLSMKSSERFIELWLEGDMPITLAPMLTHDLFVAYVFWCKQSREKFEVTELEFLVTLGRHEFVNKMAGCKYDIWHGSNSVEKKGAFAIPVSMLPKSGQSKKEWLTKSRDIFIEEFKEWRDSVLN